MSTEEHEYQDVLPTCEWFHRSGASHRSIVGPVGSGKTTAACQEIAYYLPWWMLEEEGIRKTRWCIVRNTYIELVDTTQRTMFDWFDWGDYHAGERTLYLSYPDDGPEVEIMFRSCDRQQDMKKFKSLELTGYWIDESIEVPEDIKRMLNNRIGRYPRKCPTRFAIETSNPPDIEDHMYWQYDWQNSPVDMPGPVLPPGPKSPNEPLDDHEGFWQPPGENVENLRPGYYADLRRDYADAPDWIDMYIDGKPGIIVQGKPVYNNFKREHHESRDPLVYAGGSLYVGWDNSGNTPACVVVQIPRPRHAQVLAEFWSDKMGIVDFGNYVVAQLNSRYPQCPEMIHYGDPAGEAQYSTKAGGFTSNAQLMREECNIDVQASEQNFRARIESVEQMLGRIDGVLMDPSCLRLINGFIGGYCYPPNKTVMGEFLPNVIKNKYSHPHDALQYVFVKLFRAVNRRTDIELSKAERQKEGFYDEEYEPINYGI